MQYVLLRHHCEHMLMTIDADEERFVVCMRAMCLKNYVHGLCFGVVLHAPVNFKEKNII